MDRQNRPQAGVLVRGLTIAGLLTLSACAEAPQDQLVEDFGIAYIKRPVATETDPDTNEVVLVDPDVRELLTFNAGGDVWYRDRASPSATERNITACLTQGLGDVRDLEASFDGTKIIFSLRLADPDPNDDVVPSWNLYEYDTETGACPERVIGSDIRAEEGDDLAPHYLPDGRIVFTSTRQKTSGAVLTDEGKDRFPALDEDLNEAAALLHVMSADGTDIQQISFNQSHDLDPSVLRSGEILFTRWDHMGGRNAMNLYQIRPDGTGLKAVYGVHDHAVGTANSSVQFLSPRELEDGKILVMLKPFNGSAGGGAPVLIDVANYADNTQPSWPNQGILGGTAQTPAVAQDVRSDGSISPAGRYRGFYPLWDGTHRALVSWSQCRLQEADRVTPCPDDIPADAVEAFPLYGIYIYDLDQDTQLPVVVPEEGVVIEEPVVAAPRERPEILFDKAPGFELDQDLAEEGVGLLHIRSVYDFDGRFSDLGTTATGITGLADLADPGKATPEEHPARFLRIVKSVPIPDDDVLDFDRSAFGRSQAQKMREIIGYAPVQPDGSVLVKVPANVPLAISVLDADGQRIGARHQNWLQLRPGETLACNGCHDHSPADNSAPLPHGYADAPAALNAGAPTGPYVFPGTAADIEAEMGETMAQTRMRILCPGSIAQVACPQLSPSVNLLSVDEWWTDPQAAPAPAIDLRYADPELAYFGIAAPATPTCQTRWSVNCRTVINYETHIHPLWSQPRVNATLADRTCTTCHNSVDAVGVAQVPAGQLDLGDGPYDVNDFFYKAYAELLFPDNEQEVAGGILQDVLVPAGNLIDPDTGLEVLDGNGNPIPVFDTVRANGPSMSVAGARASYFMGIFLDPTDPHFGDLSATELRLIAEWLDIGGQYYNNPFDAPLD